jgi:hypothetical protein
MRTWLLLFLLLWFQSAWSQTTAKLQPAKINADSIELYRSVFNYIPGVGKVDFLPNILTVAFHRKGDPGTTYTKIKPLLDSLGLEIYYSLYPEPEYKTRKDSIIYLLQHSQTARMVILTSLKEQNIPPSYEAISNHSMEYHISVLQRSIDYVWKTKDIKSLIAIELKRHYQHQLNMSYYEYYTYMVWKKDRSYFNFYNDSTLAQLRKHELVNIAGPALSDSLKIPYLVFTNSFHLNAATSDTSVTNVFGANYSRNWGAWDVSPAMGLGMLAVMQRLTDFAPEIWWPLTIGVNEF